MIASIGPKAVTVIGVELLLFVICLPFPSALLNFKPISDNFGQQFNKIEQISRYTRNRNVEINV